MNRILKNYSKLKESRKLFNINVDRDNKIYISEVTPNEAEYIVRILKQNGISSSYTYIKGLYFQYVYVNERNSPFTLNRIKTILSTN